MSEFAWLTSIPGALVVSIVTGIETDRLFAHFHGALVLTRAERKHLDELFAAYRVALCAVNARLLRARIASDSYGSDSYGSNRLNC